MNTDLGALDRHPWLYFKKIQACNFLPSLSEKHVPLVAQQTPV